MTLFELVRREVTAEAAARLYGLRFDRSGRAFCPWHEDGKHAALAFYSDGHCHCFACHEGGDATALTAQILGLSMKEAAERLRADFHLDTPTDNRPDPSTKARAAALRDAREQSRRRWGFLCDVVHEADAELPRYRQESAWDNPRFVAVLKARSRADEQLSFMWGTNEGVG